jgi:NAD(P)-dependent dehydrogenase (short-subunit alcohol dehydrogenase family)
MTDSDQEAKAACIVGACGGIGMATVRRLAADGYGPIICMDLPGPGLDAVAETVSGIAIPIDLARPSSIDVAFSAARQQVSALRVLVMAAGIVDNGKLADLERERWDQVIAINLSGVFLSCQAARSWVQDGGRIVVLGSLAGRTGGVLTGAAYAASKGGVEALSKSMAQELAARRITVNSVSPGAIDTPMLAAHSEERKASMAASTPLQRLGQPEEIASAIAYLASDEAGFITGSVLSVNGGIRMD